MSFQGIADIDSFQLPTVQSVITIGTKSKTGAPSQTNFFFIKDPNTKSVQNGKRSFLVRENHPQFNRFNNSENLDLRQNIILKITAPIHLRESWASMEETLKFYLKAQYIRSIPKHPKNGPHCTGDGKDAKRWDGNTYQPIKCPNRECQYRKDPADCKPFVQLFGMLHWEDEKPWSELPKLFTKWETRSWHNLVKVILPFFRGIHNQAIALGYNENYSFEGLLVKLTLSKRRSQKGSYVPAIEMSLVSNLESFLKEQNQ